MKKFLLLATMFFVLAGAAHAQSTGQQGSGGTPEPRDNPSSSDSAGSKYGAASEPGSDGSNMTTANPNGRSGAATGPSNSTGAGSASPTAEQLSNDVDKATSKVPPRR
jgi:hypothetical protein